MPFITFSDALSSGSALRHYEGSGPDQSKEMCLLDLPSASHFSPKASTLCVVALPQVAICPGPTSEPGAFSNCTRWPDGVIGPVNASARADTLPGTSARQKARSVATSKSIGTTSIPSTCGEPQIADRRAGVPPACPLNTICSASCCRELALLSTKRPTLKSVA